ncbi:uncharacterized protein [Temnothorax longispinosus]|uniref:uncharacterized protein n=1 Tax=Temnothorax longispinosus TaxID=300112 RepID=UPI003A998811
MPNLKGSSEFQRRLYYYVVMSIILYGAPNWSEDSAAARRRQLPLRRAQRVTALRVVSAYRTVSLDAATMIARIPPYFFVAECRKIVYTRIKELRGGDDWTIDAERDIKTEEEASMRR